MIISDQPNELNSLKPMAKLKEKLFSNWKKSPSMKHLKFVMRILGLLLNPVELSGLKNAGIMKNLDVKKPSIFGL